MARRTEPDSSPAQVVVASARRIDLSNKDLVRKQLRNPDTWQEEAWAFYETGEVKYPLGYRANGVARLRLYAATRPSPDAEPIPVSDPGSGISPEVAARADETMARLHAEVGGQRALLRDMTLNLDVAGECYLIGEDEVTEERDPETDKVIREARPERWGVYSTSAVSWENDTLRVKETPNDQHGRVIDLESAFMLRIWQPHARWPGMPDCELRGVLDKLDELGILSRMIRAQALSRLTRGILFINSDLDFRRPADATLAEGQADGQAKEDHPFVADLIKAASLAIQDEGNPSAVVPMVVLGKGDQIDAEKNWHLKLDSEIDSQAIELRKELRQGIAEGMPVPVEVSKGMGDSNHWTAWQVTEDTFRAHIEPAGISICEALSAGYLRPMLTASADTPLGGTVAGVDAETAARIFVWYDATELVVKPNRAQDAKDAHDAFVISDDELRDALGFGETAAPTDAEIAKRIGIKRGIIDGSITEVLLSYLLPQLLPQIQAIRDAAAERDAIDVPSSGGDAPAGDAEDEEGGPPEGDGQATTAAAGAPTLDLGAQLADLDRVLSTRLEVAASMALERALERAGARLRSKVNGDKRLRATLANVPQAMVAATLGPALVASSGLTEDELLAEAFDGFAAQFDTWVADAQTAAREAIAASLGDLPDHDYDTQAAEDRAAAWAWCRDALMALARQRLYDPNPSVPDLGENDPSMTVPVPLIREAMTRAGGMEGVELTPITAAGWAADYMASMLSTGGGTKPAGLVATGQNARRLAQAAGAVVDRYEWAYAALGMSRSPFAGHRQLDGVRFSSWDDQRLAVQAGDTWLPWATYRTGDHRGCRCMAIPVWQDGRSLRS